MKLLIERLLEIPVCVLRDMIKRERWDMEATDMDLALMRRVVAERTFRTPKQEDGETVVDDRVCL